MQRFGYRTPRYAVNFPVRLRIHETAQVARCRNISLDGLRLEVKDPLPHNAIGDISFDYEDLSLDLTVRVAHSGSTFSGLRFVYQSEEQKSAVANLISKLAAPQSSGEIFVVPETRIIRKPAST